MSDDCKLEPGKFYLFACPWDWTFVGEYVGHWGNMIVIRNGGYFRRTGATFDILSESGFTKGTIFCARKDGAAQQIPAGGPWWPWTAETPWVKKGGRR